LWNTGRASHSAVGWRVTSNHSSCRRPWPRTRNANNRSKVRVGTTQRSMAAIACAWFRKNVFQLCEGDPSCTMYLETVDWAGARKLIRSHVGSWIGGWHFCYSRRRTPAPPLLPAFRNFTPASSSALRVALIVRGKSSSPRSKRVMVFVDTFAAAASSRTPICTAARAILLDHTCRYRSPLLRCPRPRRRAPASLDHLIGEGEDRVRDSQPDRPRGLEIED
jgi:hypothetical protein